jgi:hypothetical protein
VALNFVQKSVQLLDIIKWQTFEPVHD